MNTEKEPRHGEPGHSQIAVSTEDSIPQEGRTLSPVADFLSLLFENCDSGWLTIWRLPDKKTEWFEVPRQLHDAASYAEKIGGRFDVYFGVALQAEKATRGRGTARSVSLIPIAWLDLDIGDHGAGKRYFPTEEAALKFVKTLPVQPSVITRTGGGLHVFWKFDEPIEDREDAARIINGWQSFICAQTEFDIDDTSDLARVLRIPGTTNTKYENTTVEVIELSDRECSPSDLKEFIGELPPATREKRPREWWDHLAQRPRKGQRNNAVASVTGFLIHVIDSPDMVVTLAMGFGKMCIPPLPEEESAKTILSICRSEMRKREDG